MLRQLLCEAHFWVHLWTANTDIPQKYFKDIGFNYCLAGGAQTNAKGWALNEYEVSHPYLTLETTLMLLKRVAGSQLCPTTARRAATTANSSS